MTAASSPPVILSTPVEGVRLLLLNRPQMRNAMTEELTQAWVAAWHAIGADETARCVVVTGAGPTFCSGADLSWLDQGASDDVTPDKLRTRMRPFYQAWLTPRYMEIPVIAAVNGAAIGAGLAVALACDLRYGAEHSVFSAPFIHLGTHPGIAMTFLLPEAIGMSRAREMLFSGRNVGASEALDWGLVTGISTDPVDQALSVAGSIASAAPIATRLAKAGLRHSQAGLEASVEWEALAQPITMATKDLHEGIQARRAHRTPEFKGW